MIISRQDGGAPGLAVRGASLVIQDWPAEGPASEYAPLHVHHADDEAWHVVSGALRFRFAGDQEVIVRAGSTVLVPAGTAHTFGSAGTGPSRYVIILRGAPGRAKETLGMLKESNNYLPYAKQVLDKGWVKPNKRIFDNSKISDHFAIIPTAQAPKNLSEPEQKLYDLVVKRFLSVFFPAAEYRVTTRITEVVGHHFKTEGKVLVEPGWLQVYGREISGEDANLVPVQKDEKVKTDKIAAQQLVTKPPARYNEATLLSAMEGAGKLVEDDELREAMAAKGLGTPATRAAIIEGLLGEKYLIREGRDLIPTAKAFQLMTLLRGLGVKELTAPELTGEWEYKLSQMERGNLPRDAFMQEIARMTQTIVKRAKEYDSDTIPGDYATLQTPCPNCGGQVKENYRALRVLEVRVFDLEDSGRTSVRNSGSRRAVAEQDDRTAVGFPQQDGPPVLGDPEALARRRDQELQARIRLRSGFGRRRRRTA